MLTYWRGAIANDFSVRKGCNRVELRRLLGGSGAWLDRLLGQGELLLGRLLATTTGLMLLGFVEWSHARLSKIISYSETRALFAPGWTRAKYVYAFLEMAPSEELNRSAKWWFVQPRLVMALSISCVTKARLVRSGRQWSMDAVYLLRLAVSQQARGCLALIVSPCISSLRLCKYVARTGRHGKPCHSDQR